MYYPLFLGEIPAERTLKRKIPTPMTKDMIVSDFYNGMVEIFSAYEDCYVPKNIDEIKIENTKYSQGSVPEGLQYYI